MVIIPEHAVLKITVGCIPSKGTINQKIVTQIWFSHRNTVAIAGLCL